MTKNMTLSIPDELFSQMSNLSEVNWSAVAKKAIEEYIADRNEPEIATLIEKMKEKKNQAYKEGFERAAQIIEDQSYEIIDSIFEKQEEKNRTYQNLNKIMAKNLIEKKNARIISSEVQRQHLLSSLIELNFVSSNKKSREYNRGICDALEKIRERVKRDEN